MNSLHVDQKVNICSWSTRYKNKHSWSTRYKNKQTLVYKCECPKLYQLFLFNPMATSNNPMQKVLRKHCWKRRKCWLPAFSPFRLFSTLAKKKIAPFETH